MDRRIALVHLDLINTQIAVMLQWLEIRIFAQAMNHVKWRKVTVIPMMNAKVIFFVDQTIVQHQFFQKFKIQMSALVPVIKVNGRVITIVMMKTTIVDVDGMEATVVVVMLTQNFVQLVSVLIHALKHVAFLI